MSNDTTATAATAGAAFGALLGWVVAAVTGTDTAAISSPLAVLGAFFFGQVFPR